MPIRSSEANSSKASCGVIAIPFPGLNSVACPGCLSPSRCGGRVRLPCGELEWPVPRNQASLRAFLKVQFYSRAVLCVQTEINVVPQVAREAFHREVELGCSR